MTPDEELFDAVDKGDHDRVRNLLLPAKTASIEVIDGRGDNVLHQAAWEGKTNVVQVLTETDRWKEIVDIKGYLGWTALHNCCLKGDTETIKLLLDKGANPEVTDHAGWTPLHHAVSSGYLAAVKLLVERQKNFNQKTNTSGATALHMAAKIGFAKIVRTLIDKNADKSATASDGETVLHWALEGAITEGQDHNSEDEAEEEGHDTNLDDEVMSFNDNGANQRSEHSGLEEGAEDDEHQYGEVFKHILRDMNDEAKWTELLKVARREERMETLQYLMSEMYTRQTAERLQRPLKRIWLAMSEARTQDLMEMLLAEVRDNTESMEKRRKMEKWDILSLATSLGKGQTVYWLLRSRRWPKSGIEKAKHLPFDDRLNHNGVLWTGSEIWYTPFVHDERSGGESYRWPDTPESPDLSSFGAAIMDFHKVDNRIVSIYYDCDTSSLIHQGENHGPKEIVKRYMESLENQDNGGVVKTEDSDNSLCYRWIHLAINSVPWMKDLAMISYLEREAKREEWMATWQVLRRSWQELPDNRDEEPYMRPNCLKEYLPQPKSKTGKESTSPKHDESMRLALALYMPYLTFGPFENTPHDKSLEDEHKGGILHQSRTLDQFYHSIQDDTRARDKDQVFTRYVDPELRQKLERGDTNFDILRVNQLWLWVIDEKTVITSTTHGLKESDDPVFQGFLERLCQSQTMFNREPTPSSVDSFVKLITSFYINALDNLKVSPKAPSAQTMQESSDGQNDGDQAHRTANTTESTTGNTADSTTESKKTRTASLTKVFADSIEYNNLKERNLRQEFRKAMNDKTSISGDLHNSIVRAMDILDDIKDIRGELNIIDSVVQEQKTVWFQLFNQFRGFSTRDDTSKDGSESYQWSNTDPDYVLKRVKDLLREAEETEHNITSVLELEMNQLNVSEAEEARMQGEEARKLGEESRKQGKILMAFTIVTVIFFPLSFLASLFALDVSTFPHVGNDVQYNPGWIFGIMFGVTLAFILIILPFTVFQEAFSGTIADVITKSQELIRKDSRSTGPQHDDTRQIAGGNGRESLTERLKQLWRRFRTTNLSGDRAPPAAAQRSRGNSPV